MRAFILLIVLGFLSACQSPETSVAKTEVDAIYTNGTIWTGNEENPSATFMAIKDDRITAIGNTLPDDLISDYRVDLGGQFVMAGFMDNHVHFMEGGAALNSVDLRDAASPDEFTRRIADYAAGIPEGRWVLNGNWDQTLWADENGNAELPHRDWIDPATPDTPVYVIRLDGHMGLANSKALKIAGITKNTPVPEGGEILRDENGELTGILKGAALNLILEKIPPPSEDEILDQFKAAQDHALSLGLTKVHAVTAYPTETTMLDIFQLARDKGIMKLRAQVSTPLESWETMAEASKNGTGDELLRWGGVKGFMDGSLGSRTAWMEKPYTDDPSTSGLPMTESEVLFKLMVDADRAGLQMSIHAIGDQGIAIVQKYFMEIGARNSDQRRHRIEHFQHPQDWNIGFMVKTGVIASVHPYHAIDDGRWAEDRIGAERLKTTYPFRSILDAGGIMTFGSDWPVAPLNPMDGVYAAVTRRTLDDKNPDGWVPEQKITVEEALTAYTATNAYSFKEGGIAGTLEAGKRADFVVLSADPRTVDPNTLRDITVLKTVIGGDMVFERSEVSQTEIDLDPASMHGRATKPLSIQADTLNEDWAVEWWLPRHEQKLKNKTEQTVGLIFIGDSITHGWEGEGKPVWDERFSPRDAFNLGFSGDRTENVLWRLQNGAVDGLSPKLAVIMIGTNNTGHRMDSAEDTVMGITRILETLETRLPETQILLLGIFPRGKTPDDPGRIRNVQINTLLKSISRSNVYYRDIGDVFVDEDGTISEEIMPDHLHLSPKGYRLWAKAIEADIARLMGGN